MIRGLDVFRAFAFFMVLLFHAEVIRFGYLGVQAFFVLSGFLLTPILLRMKEELPAGQFFSRFYGRRALRIFPLYYGYLILAGLVIFTFSFFPALDLAYLITTFKQQVLWAVFYVYDFYPTTCEFSHNYFLGHFWSLAVEEQFYLVWPLLLFLIPKSKLKYALWAIVALGPIIRGLTFAYGDVLSCAATNPESNLNLVVYTLPFSHFDSFAIGGLLALIPPIKPRIQLIVVGGLLIVLGLGSQFHAIGTFAWRSLGYEPFMAISGQHIWGYSLFNYFFAICISLIASGRFLPLIFENKVLNYLGKISYGLYVFHFPILFGFKHIGLEPGFMLCAATFPVTVVISALSYELMEKRFLKWKDTLFPRTNTPV